MDSETIEAIDYLLRAKESLRISLEYESSKHQYSICALLLHLQDCIEIAIKCLEKPHSYSYKADLSKRLIERGL